MAYIAQYKLWKWYSTVGIVWKQLWILSLTVPKVEWFALYHTNLSHKVPLSFVWLKFSSFGWDIDMRRIRSGKTLRLGIPKAPQVNIQGRSMQLSLGMRRKASPLSSPTLSVTSLGALFLFVTWCVLLGASFYFGRICFLLFIIMFCIFYFNKSSIDSLCHAYLASIHVAVWKQKVYRCCKNSRGRSECDKMLKLFA